MSLHKYSLHYRLSVSILSALYRIVLNALRCYGTTSLGVMSVSLFIIIYLVINLYFCYVIYYKH